MRFLTNKTLLFLAISTLLSCTEPYSADIDAGQEVLVINGFLCNQAGKNYVILTTASPYDSIGAPKYVRNAQVYVTDINNRVYPFREISRGCFEPVDPAFAGVAKKSYTLTVKTSDGNLYTSKPEILMPALLPQKVSGGYSKRESLVKNYYSGVTKTVDDVCELYYDYKSDDGNLPRFRFTSFQLIEYTIYKELIPPVDGKTGIMFYCWITFDDKELRFTNEKYKSNSTEINKQLVAVTTADRKIEVHDVDMRTLDLNTQVMMITWEYKRIIKINQYRLNPDAYSYYKGIERQSDAEGKMFDPMTSQLYGNMQCTTNPDKLVLGFFEVSSVTTSSWAVFRNGPGTQIVITSAPNVDAYGSGFTIDQTPPFWIL
jgi:hypothetical protein